MFRSIQFIYLLLVLPAIFGIVLITEGISKVSQQERSGWFSIFLGILFLGAVVFAYLFFSLNLE